MSQSLIESLSQVVSQNPKDIALRLHLAKLLLDANEPQDALKHCAQALANSPDSLEALELAALSARAGGEERVAEGYLKLYAALSGGNMPTSLVLSQGSTQGAQALGKINPVKAPAPPVSATDYSAKQVSDNSGAWDDIPIVSDDSAPFVAQEDGHNGVQPDEEDEVMVPVEEIKKEGLEQLWEMELPTISLKDVAGMEAVKRRLNMTFLAPMRDPRMRQLFKKSLRGGLLLYGPPGCGKTYIARATAGELGANFISIGIADVLDMWLGSSERNLHEIFQMARRHAPCVLFFDEIDALGHKRSNLKHSAGRNVINQLLFETDSANYDNEGVFILAATNHPWDVDSALKRPGRLDRTLLVLPPDLPARRSVVQMNMDGRPLDRMNIDRVLEGTDGFSCADLVALCDTATEFAMEYYVEHGTLRNISEKDFKQAKKEVRPSTLAWFETARNYAMFANEGGAYDELVDYLRMRKLL